MSSYTFRRSGPQMDALFDEIPTKQKEISVTAMANGNIRLGNLQGGDREFMPATPSGDPMHYMYEQWGAMWNGMSGYWELNGLTDLTNADMRQIWDTRFFPLPPTIVSTANARTNFFKQANRYTFDVPQDATALFRYSAVEVVKVQDTTNNSPYPWKTSSIDRLFYQCPKLRKVIGTIWLTSTNAVAHMNPFQNCYELEEVFVKNINKNLAIGQSPKLNKDSLLFMINNASPTSAMTITVHADVYAWAMADADILAALKAQPNVSLVTA